MQYDELPKKKSKAGCFIPVMIIVVMIFGHSLIRLIQDAPIYKQGHAAYLKGDCDLANSLYSQVKDKGRVIDMGGIKQKSGKEYEECRAYLDVKERSFSAMHQFSVAHPGSPLSQYLKANVVVALNNFQDDSDFSVAFGDNSCEEKQFFLDGWLDESDSLPKFKYFCSLHLVNLGAMETALIRVKDILFNYPDHEVYGKTMNLVVNTPIFCPQIDDLISVPAFSQDQSSAEDKYFSCGENYTNLADYANASSIYQKFLDQYPYSYRAEDARALLAEALIANARQSGAGIIEEPGESGSAPLGVTRVVIQNDSPEEITLVFSGAETRFETIARCDTCIEYSTSPLYCPEEGPIATFDLLPGEYEVLVEAKNDDGVIPFTGSWFLEDSTEFYSCFFIVTSYYP